MNNTAVQIEDKVRELLDVLEKDIGHIEQNLSRLSELRAFVVKRDNDSLEKLLDRVRTDVQEYEANEMNRRFVREQLADILGCDYKQVTLSRLERIVSKDSRAVIAQCKSRLSTLVRQLGAEHKSTMMLISDLSRFNRVLLNSMFDKSRIGDMTYNAGGAAQQQSDAAFLSFQL
jgi:hypothetical protein